MTKRVSTPIFIFFIFYLLCSFSFAYDLTLNNTLAQVYFSPKGGCTQAIVKEIDNAAIEVLVQAYSFTSAPIAHALVNAKKRAVNVEVIVDKSQRKEPKKKGASYTSATFLANMKIPTYVDDKHAIAHNKIIIIDKQIVITGSFNFSKAAEESNAENLLIIRNPELAGIYLDNWQKHKAHSEKLVPRY
ncbi:MAG TPA: phospholipase D family protein [Syntrophorhabdaceae bacterium]|nr:MAG: Phospholipase D precursor [Deltaproteobacteria bacterium ADurb.Bin135]HNQ63096.1 phospholipase D family protein [Syntrophorhabdaceae bacterium]